MALMPAPLIGQPPGATPWGPTVPLNTRRLSTLCVLDDMKVTKGAGVPGGFSSAGLAIIIKSSFGSKQSSSALVSPPTLINLPGPKRLSEGFLGLSTQTLPGLSPTQSSLLSMLNTPSGPEMSLLGGLPTTPAKPGFTNCSM